MTIDLHGLDLLGFTESQAYNVVNNNGEVLFAWVDFENKENFTIAQQKAAAADIFQEIKKFGSVDNCGGNAVLALQFHAPLSWVEQVTDAIFLVVEQIKNGAVPTEV